MNDPTPPLTDEELERIREAVDTRPGTGTALRWADEARLVTEVDRLRAELSEMSDEVHMHRMNHSIAVGDAYNEHTKRQAAQIEELTAKLEAVERDLDEQRWYGEQLQMSVDSCLSRHEIPEYDEDGGETDE
jgi:hypothetical protein